MTPYKLSNSIKRDLLACKHMHFNSVKCQKFSFALLNKLFSQYYASWSYLSYCCQGEDYNCWCDDYSSDWPDCDSKNIAESNRAVYQSLKKNINRDLSRKKIGRRSICVAEGDRYITVVIPMRDVGETDTHICFDKSRPISC